MGAVRVQQARGFRRAMVVLVATVLAVVLAACDPTPKTLTGSVMFDGGGPATGLAVAAYADDTETLVASTTVAADGTFSFHESTLPSGDYRLLLGTSRWWTDAASWADAETVTASADTPPAIDATIAASFLSGTVTSDGSPVAGATVEALVPGVFAVVATATTAADGSYDATLPNGTYTVRITAAGKATTYHDGTNDPYAEPLTIGAGEARTIDVVMGADAILSGHLNDGGPAVGVIVTAFPTWGPVAYGTAVTDATGAFTISGLPAGEYWLQATRRGGTAFLHGTVPTGTDWTHYVATADCPYPEARPYTSLFGNHPDVDMSGCNLTGSDLAGSDLTSTTLRGTDLTDVNLDGAILTGGDLTSATLSGANLRNADLTGADLTNADLTDADLTGATLSGANLEGATLGGVRSGGIGGVPSVLPGPWRLTAGHLIGPGADLAGAYLLLLDLSGANLSGADLSGSVLIRTDLSGADMSGANLYRAEMSETVLSGADASGANLYGAWMDLADLRNADLTDALLVDAVLTRATLDGADLSGAWLVNADLGQATLHGTNLSGSWLNDAVLTGVASSGITGAPAALPPGWAIVDGKLVG